MKTTFKRSLGVILALLMLLCVPAAAYAAEDGVVLSGSAGGSVTWKITDDGVLTVSGTGAIEDETETEVDDEGYTCSNTLDSISMTFDRYFSERTESLSAAERARTRFDLVREIVVEEGVTEIPSGEFSGMYPAKITLPSTLEVLGYDAFDLQFAESLTVKSVKLDHLGLYAPAYESDAEPYESLAAAREDYIALADAQEAFEFEMIPFDVLFNCAYIALLPDEAYWLEMDEEARQEILDFYNAHLGTDAAQLEALAPAALEKLNERFGTAYAGVEDIFTVETDDDGNNSIVADPALQEMIDAENEALYDTIRLVKKPIEDVDDNQTAYGWFTVTAPAGGSIEKDCRAAGVTFAALDGVTVPEAEGENENACKFCGKDHSGSFWQRMTGFFHRIFYFFAHLFGKM